MTAKINIIQKSFILTFLFMLIIIISQFIVFPFQKIILAGDTFLLVLLSIFQLIGYVRMKGLLVKTSDILSRGNERDFSVLRDKEKSIINYKIVSLIEQLEDSVEQSKIAIDEKEKLLEEAKNSKKFVEMIQENLNKNVVSIKNQILNTIDIIEKLSMDFSTLIESQEKERETLKSLVDVYSTYEDSFDTINQSVEKTRAVTNREINRSKQLILSLSELYDQSENKEEQLTTIFKGIDKIRDVADIINDVAEKASILSLNAAIESAHAGEAGKGFAVVAEEVGVLANTTAEHAENINEALYSVTDMITDNQQIDSGDNGSYPDLISDVKGINEAFIKINEFLTLISLPKKPETLDKTDHMNQNRDIITESLNKLSIIKKEIANSIQSINQLVLFPSQFAQEKELHSKVKINETSLKPVDEEESIDL